MDRAITELIPPQLSWEAELNLGFTKRDNRSILSSRNHRGPLVVQKALYPEGDAICHAIILHPPGGVAGGDRLNLVVDVGAEAHALLTTPGAGKWYKANGKSAAQHNNFYAHENAVLEWLPQESIVYDAAHVFWHTRIDLAATACYAGWEITCLGRKASGEQFREGNLKQSLQIFRANRLIWGEHTNLTGGDKLLTSAVGLKGCAVTATFVIAAGHTDADVLKKCRSILPVDDGTVGVSALPEIFVGRYLGHSAQAARLYFEELWTIMRPICAGVNAQRPRIWNT